MLARTCTDERGRDTGALSSDKIRQESVALIAAAKKAGCFVDVAKVPGTRYTIRTGESEVRLVQREQGIFAGNVPTFFFPQNPNLCASASQRDENSMRICRGFLIDGERGFMVLYACSLGLNSVATEVRTGALKAVG